MKVKVAYTISIRRSYLFWNWWYEVITVALLLL